MNARILKTYNLPKRRFLELKYFALQYAEYKSKVADIILSSGNNNDGMPRGTDVGNPTERTAILIDPVQRKIDAIDKAVRLCCVDASLQASVLYAVTHEKASFERVKALGILFTERDAFYIAKRRFYYELDKLV